VRVREREHRRGLLGVNHRNGTGGYLGWITGAAGRAAPAGGPRGVKEGVYADAAAAPPDATPCDCTPMTRSRSSNDIALGRPLGGCGASATPATGPPRPVSDTLGTIPTCPTSEAPWPCVDSGGPVTDWSAGAVGVGALCRHHDGIRGVACVAGIGHDPHEAVRERCEEERGGRGRGGGGGGQASVGEEGVDTHSGGAIPVSACTRIASTNLPCRSAFFPATRSPRNRSS
jgi:hypothetical protein